MKKILSIFGTRPEAIKMAPVVKALEEQSSAFNSRVCVTAQHREMLDSVLHLFEIKPDHDLDVMRPGQDLFDLTCSVLKGLETVLNQERPDMVLVHGDTTTSMVASIAAFYLQIPVGHVEAGLRTRNKFAPFPEEINRQITGRITDLHFAPTESARQNLLAESIAESSIHVTGNTVIDGLLMAVEKIRQPELQAAITAELVDRFPASGAVLPAVRSNEKQLILVTAHRRENFGRGFENICRALKEIAATHPNVEVVYPVHLNPNVRNPVNRILAGELCIHLIEPLDYLPFVLLLDLAHLVITDSGGVQEEAPSLGKPVLVMRDTTERPEAVDAGTVKLVGTDRETIVRETNILLTDPAAYTRMSLAHNPYGDGQAARRIVKVISRS